MNPEAVGAVKRALAGVEALEKQLMTVQNELKLLQRILTGEVQVETEKKVEEAVENKYILLAKRLAASQWEKMTTAQKEALVEALQDVEEAYKEKRTVSVKTVRVLGDLYKLKKKTLFNLMLINLPVNWIVEKQVSTLRHTLFMKLQSKDAEKLRVLKPGTLETRPAAMSYRTFEKITGPKSMGDVKLFIDNIVKSLTHKGKRLTDF